MQHTPDPKAAGQSLADVVEDEGRIAVTIYERRWSTMLYSKYWVRPVTRRIKAEWLLNLIKIIMPVAFILSEVLFRIPVLKRIFQFILPVANYVDSKELSMRQRYQWAVLDTFDMLEPAYDNPQRYADVVEIMKERNIGEIQRLSNPGLNLVGTKISSSEVAL